MNNFCKDIYNLILKFANLDNDLKDKCDNCYKRLTDRYLLRYGVVGQKLKYCSVCVRKELDEIDKNSNDIGFNSVYRYMNRMKILKMLNK